MYSIQRKEDGYHCSVVIQDGTEYFTEPTKTQAIQAVILAARMLNHAYISTKDINISDIIPPKKEESKISQEDTNLLKKIKSGSFKVLEYNDLRIKYNITDEECKLIQEIREGDVILKSKKTGKCIDIYT